MSTFIDSTQDHEGQPGPAAPSNPFAAKLTPPPRRRRPRRPGRRLLMVSGLAAILVAGIVLFSPFSDDLPVTAPKGTEHDAITIGYEKAPATLTLYEDFTCAACHTFENDFGPTVRQLLTENRLKVVYKPVAASGNGAAPLSAQAANAVACAQDAGKFDPYRQALVGAAPTDVSGKAGLLAVADRVDGLRTPQFEQCLNKSTHAGWVERLSKEFAKQPHKDTIAAALNGKQLDIDGPQAATTFWKTVQDIALQDVTFMPPVPPKPSAAAAPSAQMQGGPTGQSPSGTASSGQAADVRQPADPARSGAAQPPADANATTPGPASQPGV
ncbi:thioredoxin domain-containing protein [Kitasatospora sp. NPDC086791]|uniref:thioredoxin domain-containing protein n=1 Tax=Kitasatospora sp. NPDC086791 TaxID=3155178 RepID=UPI003446E8A3